MENLLEMLSVGKAVETLNEALKADPACISSLVCVRRSCGKVMADHPTIICATHGDGESERYTLGWICLLNGLFGSAGSSLRIAAVFDDTDNQNVIRFEARPASEFAA